MKISLSEKPTSLRDCLGVIEMLLRSEFGHDLWNVLTGLRGPDSRDRKLKYATTAVIRKAAFPGQPAGNLSVFKDDSTTYAARRIDLFLSEGDTNHFREHVTDAFDSLGLELFKKNEENK